MKTFYEWQNEDLILFCHLQPKASTDEFAGLHDGRLKIRIKAPPVDGKANKYLIKFLAKNFKVPNRQVILKSGDLSRKKTFHITKPMHLPECLNIGNKP